MNVRIVVADERLASFFDASKPRVPMIPRGSLHNETGGVRDIELESDRPGRRFGGTSGHRHGVDGERSTEQHRLTLFAKEVAERIDEDRAKHEFDKLVLVAPPKMLGLLRQSLTHPSQGLLAAEVPKDLLHEGHDAILNAVPTEAFWDV